MSLERLHIRPGRSATSWLTDRVGALQAADPLAAVTVVVPSNHAGLHLRRHFATSGYANVRFTTLGRLADILGAERLAGQGLTPLQPVSRAALVRSALRAGGSTLAAAAEQPGLVDLVTRLAAELRRRADPAGDTARIRATGTHISDAVLATLRAYETRRAAAALYDEIDVREAAAASLSELFAAAPLHDIGAVIVHLPEHLDLPDGAFLEALSTRTRVVVAQPEPSDIQDSTPATVSVLIAPDPVEEVRSSVRAALAAAERQGTPLHRTAIVYRDADTYRGLLRDVLDEAGLPQATLDGRPLAESAAARALLGLLRLRDQGFTRAAVLGWLSALPGDGGILSNQARWDKLSRDARVIRGVRQWHDLLNALADHTEARLAKYDKDVEEPNADARRHAMRYDIDDARTIAQHVKAIDARTVPPPEATWHAYIGWALGLLTEFVTPGAAWTDEDHESLQAVEELIRGLDAAHDIEPAVSVHVFLRALEDALRARHRPAGRMGVGLITGPHHLLLGIDVERVHVLGVIEGSFPSSPPVDPLLAGDPLGRQPEREARERRDWLAVLAAADGGDVVVTAPASDIDGRTVYPSPWLLETLAVKGRHPRASEVRAGSAIHPRLLRVTGTHVAVASGTPLSLAERRETEALLHGSAHDLRGSALGRREDLPLGRALQTIRARRSSELTEFDGDVAAAADLDSIAGGLSGRLQSATGIQTWATCPFHYFLGRVLSIAATKEADDDRWWQIDAGERGTLIHAILQRFFTEVRESKRPQPGSPYGDADLRRMDAIAAEAFADAERRHLTGHPLVWRNERTAILADLRTLLAQDAEQRAEGWVPAHLEQRFGFDGDANSWPALEIRVGAGPAVRLRGSIDRVDRDHTGRARVIDYKTGSKGDPDFGVGTLLKGGRALQLPIYGRAVRDQARAEQGVPPDTVALYWYATLKANFKQDSMAVDEEAELVLDDVVGRIDRGIRAGCFPQVPGEYNDHFSACENCGFCDYDTLCPSQRDVLAAAKFGSQPLEPYRALQPAALEPGL